MTKEALLSWGVHEGQWRHINDAERGVACRCLCPTCGSPLIAKQGELTAWHYAHLRRSNCQGETALHEIGKRVVCDIAAQQTFLQLPENYKGQPAALFCYINEKGNKEYLASAKEEVRSGAFVHDVIAKGHCFESLIIEIVVTHKKSSEDITHFKQDGKTVVEIDLSSLPRNATYERIFHAVQTQAPRQWLSYPTLPILFPNKDNCAFKKLAINASTNNIVRKIEQDINEQRYRCRLLPFLLSETKSLSQNHVYLALLKNNISSLVAGKITTFTIHDIYNPFPEAIQKKTFTLLAHHFLRLLFQQNIVDHIGGNVYAHKR